MIESRHGLKNGYTQHLLMPNITPIIFLHTNIIMYAEKSCSHNAKLIVLACGTQMWSICCRIFIWCRCIDTFCTCCRIFLSSPGRASSTLCVFQYGRCGAWRCWGPTPIQTVITDPQYLELQIICTRQARKLKILQTVSYIFVNTTSITYRIRCDWKIDPSDVRLLVHNVPWDRNS